METLNSIFQFSFYKIHYNLSKTIHILFRLSILIATEFDIFTFLSIFKNHMILLTRFNILFLISINFYIIGFFAITYSLI